MYDMYPWDGAARSAGSVGSSAISAAQAAQGPAAEGARAVQVALDRRDNGGDAAAAAGQPTAGPTRQ